MADDGQAILVVRGLGAATVSVGALSLAPESDVLFMLALVLAQRAGERISRSELRALIWPAAGEESARHTLRQALYRLHKSGLVTEDRTDDILLDPARVDSDITTVLANDWPEHAEPRDIEAAATILPGVTARDQGALSEFIDSLRSRAAAQYRRAVLRRLAAVRREGRWREVEHWALMCLQADPLNEEATLARAESAAMVGAKYEALEVLDAYLTELGDRSRVIGLPARMLRKRVSELTDTSTRRIQATSVPFVGRHDVLGAVQDALATARGGESTTRWLIGPPGIGKSRLLREVERVARMAPGATILAGVRPSYADRPFALLTELLPALLDAPGALGAAPPALTLMRQMGRADSNAEPLSPEEARSRQHAIYLCWVELMDAVLAETSLTLIVDDAHWSDQLTLLMLSRFLESRPKARLGIVLAARRLPSQGDAPAAHILGAAQLRVGPLSDDDVRTFTFAAGLGSEVAYETISRRLGHASGGNPLFLSHLIHQHHMQHGDAELPSDLASLIDTQLRTLSREALRLLQACALLGRHSTLPRIERVLASSAQALVSSFSELDELLVLPADTDAPLTPHDLWTERVRAGMSAGVFRALAVSVARVLEADAAQDGSIELHWDAARLFRESGEKQLAYATMMRCAEYLVRTGAIQEATRAYTIAAEYADSDNSAYVALLGRLRSLQAIEDWDAVLPTVDEIRTLSLDRSPDSEVDLELTSFSARWARTGGDISIVARLRQLAENPTLSATARLSAAVLGMAASDNAFDAEGIRWFATAISDVEERSPVDCFKRQQTKVILETAVGDLDLAERAAALLVRMARDLQDHAALHTALKFASYPPRWLGLLDIAKDRLTEASEIAARRKQGYSLVTLNDMLAGLHFDFGRLDEAARYLHAAETCHQPLLESFRSRSARDTRIFVFAALGRWEEARGLAQKPAEILMHGKCRAQFMSIAASMLVAAHFDDRPVAEECLSLVDDVRDRLFRHSGPDHIASAYAETTAKYRGLAEARDFARWYLSSARRDRLAPPRGLTDLTGS